MTNTKENKKILAVFIVLLVLLVGIFWLRQKPLQKTSQTQVKQVGSNTNANMTGKFFFETEEKKIKVGQEDNLNLLISAKGNILDGADAIVKFDPQYLEVLEIIPGRYFSIYPRKDINNEKGIIKVTGFSPVDKKTLDKDVLFITIKVKAKNIGQTMINFDFLKGKTNLSTLVENKTSRNILNEVLGLKLLIEP